MLSFYVFSLIVGGVLLAVAAFGGDHGHDHGGVVHAEHSHGEGAAKFLSLRTITYFLFVFGGVGAGLTWAWKGVSSLIVLPIALVTGLAVGGLVGFTFRYLASTESGARDGEDSFVGLSGKVVLPFGEGRMGKVLVQRGDRAYELTARPLDESVGGSTSWKSVIVVEMSRGTALVAPLDETALPEST